MLTKEELFSAQGPENNNNPESQAFFEQARAGSLWSEARKTITAGLRESISIKSRAESLIIDELNKPEAYYHHRSHSMHSSKRVPAPEV